MIDKYLMHMKKELMKVKMDEGNKIKFKKKDIQEAQRGPGM